MNSSFSCLPYNVLDTVVSFSDIEAQLALAQSNHYLRHSLYRALYRNIMVVDANTCWQMPESHVTWTLVPADRLEQFAASLTVFTFLYVEKVVINTHSNEHDHALIQLHEKLSALWNTTNHVVSVTSYDVLSHRTVKSLNNHLASSCVQFIDIEEEDRLEVTRNDFKVTNMRDWFVSDTTEFLALPNNPNLEQLNIYVESNSYNGSPIEEVSALDRGAPLKNLQRLSSVYLHSPLSYIRFTEMLQSMQIPALVLKRLSLTSSHRPRNNAILDFNLINRLFLLNELEDLELKLSCASRHECNDSCMINFFEEWQSFNERHGLKSKIKKLSIVHHKSLTETTQFKSIVENHIVSPLFSSLEELYLNLSDSVRSPNLHISIDLVKFFSSLEAIPHLKALHISSFMNEWVTNLPQLLEKGGSSHLDVLVNQCNCTTCNQSRSAFIELAEIDKSNNYNHKAKLADIEGSTGVSTRIDFSEIANVKYLQYIAGQLKKQENCMERNLHSVGTMLNMSEMPIDNKDEMKPFIALLNHSCISAFCDLMATSVPKLRHFNLGGIVHCIA